MRNLFTKMFARNRHLIKRIHFCYIILFFFFKKCWESVRFQWCGIIHCYWWTASIKPRLLFSRGGFASWGLSLSSVCYSLILVQTPNESHWPYQGGNSTFFEEFIKKIINKKDKSEKQQKIVFLNVWCVMMLYVTLCRSVW